MEIATLVKSLKITITNSIFSDGLSDFDRLKQALKFKIDFNEVKIPLNVLQNLPVKLRKYESAEDINLIYYMTGKVLNIIDILNSDENIDKYGIAVDIGTTSVTLWFIDMTTGKINSQKTEYNSQIQYGLDVITRINYARKNLKELKQAILNTINNLIHIVINEEAISYKNIYEASIVGNTTMIHLLLGICPEYIRFYPYSPSVLDVPLFTAFDIGININPASPIKIAPSVGSYIGGDIIAGTLYTSLATKDKESKLILFLDIGTNVEILLGNNEFILGCACSAGPAFEGGEIEFGMTASKGAINGFKINENGGINITTIDNTPPTGICGSGIISIIVEMLKHNIIDSNGHFTNRILDKVRKDIKPHKFYITDTITISEIDIANLIRAKSAIFAAYQTLLKSKGLTFHNIDKIYIAGEFGKYLNISDAKALGLLPNISEEKFVCVGNTSILGAYKILLSEENQKKIYEIANRVTYINLVSESTYTEEYLNTLFSPIINILDLQTELATPR